MLPILDAQQMQAVDARTMASEPISSLDLLERAATNCTLRIMALARENSFGPAREVSFLVLVGMGNNGGDGLVIARLLHAAGYSVRVFRCEYRETASPDHISNWERLLAAGVEHASSSDPRPEPVFRPSDVVIDALFGTGLSRQVPAAVGHLVGRVAESGSQVLAIDLPSGLFAEDNSANDPRSIVRATYTFTFEFPKLALLLPENEAFVGAWEIVPIGADHAFAASLPTPYRLVQQQDVTAILRPRPLFAHKGTFGHAFVVAGSAGKAGAAVLAMRAALRSGVGLVTAHVPGAVQNILQVTCPEAMCSSGSNERPYIDSPPDLAKATALGIGPGLGSDPDTALVLKKLIQDRAVPLVLDADALNILADNPTWKSFLPPDTILTPHPKEFDRLEGATAPSGYQRLQRARQWAMAYGVILVLKGAWTAICSPSGEVFFNSTGNPGMAKGGSGDLLTGLLTGLLAQGHGPLRSTVLGVHLHGLAGDLAARHKGMDGMTAGDIVDALPEAWQCLRNASMESPQFGVD